MDRRWLIVTAILALVVYAVAWIGWSTPWSWVVWVDDAALRPTYSYGVAHPTWVAAWNALCTVFSPVAFRIVALGVLVWAALRGQWRLALYLFVSIEVPGFFTEIFKALSNRPRPDTALVHATSSSFPSGHAFGTTVAVLALLALVVPLVAPRTRALLVALGFVIAFAVGVGRVVLNVHHPTDVVAGWALGYAWFVATLPFLPTGRATVREGDGTPAGRGSSP